MDRVWKASSYREERLLVLLALADWANDQGLCWPSYDQIAQKTRITRRGAIKITQHFIQEGVVEVYKIGLGRGNRTQYLLRGESGRWSVSTVPSAEKKGERRSPFFRQMVNVIAAEW